MVTRLLSCVKKNLDLHRYDGILLDMTTKASIMLRLERTKRRYTQDELAILLGCSREMVASLENGRARPSLHLANMIQATLGISTSLWEIESCDGDAGSLEDGS